MISRLSPKTKAKPIKVAGNDLDIMRVNQDITNFYAMQIDFQLVEVIGMQ